MAVTLGVSQLSAATLSYSGNFPNGNPNALFEVNFTMSTQANLNIATSTISADGFQGVLWLFDSTGTMQLAKNDPPVDQEAVINLPAFAAGTYLLILSAFDQHYCLVNSVCNNVIYGNTGWSYNGDFGNDNLNYAFTINTNQGTLTENSTLLDPAPARAIAIGEVPEPSSATLLLIGGAALLFGRKFSRSA